MCASGAPLSKYQTLRRNLHEERAAFAARKYRAVTAVACIEEHRLNARVHTNSHELDLLFWEGYVQKLKSQHVAAYDGQQGASKRWNRRWAVVSLDRNGKGWLRYYHAIGEPVACQVPLRIVGDVSAHFQEVNPTCNALLISSAAKDLLLCAADGDAAVRLHDCVRRHLVLAGVPLDADAHLLAEKEKESERSSSERVDVTAAAAAKAKPKTKKASKTAATSGVPALATGMRMPSASLSDTNGNGDGNDKANAQKLIFTPAASARLSMPALSTNMRMPSPADDSL
jgi:hypothetical protein